MDIYAIVTETQDGLKIQKTIKSKWDNLHHMNRYAYDLGKITLYLSRPKHISESKALKAAIEFFEFERRKVLGL